jgi:phage baseplate assembly protein W
VPDPVAVPHFSFPFRLGSSGSFAVVEQDSTDEITDCVQVLLSTEVGTRAELPEYGIDDPSFTQTVDVPGILSAIDDWEPRAQVDVGVDFDDKDELIRHISVNVDTAGVITE